MKSLNRSVRLILLILVLKINPLYGQTYAYVDKIGNAPIWKRSEKAYGDYYVTENDVTKHFNNAHVGFTSKNENRMMEKNEYTFIEIRAQYEEAIKNRQLVSGMNYAEVLAIVQPYYKIIEGNKETWYFNDRGPIEFRNGTI